MAGDWISKCKLETLDLSNNELTIDGMIGLAPALSKMANLKWLNLSFNNFKDEGLRLLVEALKSEGRSLDTLIFMNNFVTDLGYEKYILSKDFRQLFKGSLLLRKNKITDNCVLANLPAIGDIKQYGQYVDLVDKYFFLDDHILPRTLYVPAEVSAQEAIRIFEKTKYTYLEDSAPGRVLSVRTKKIKTFFAKSGTQSFTFIEFEDAAQAEKGRMLGSKGGVVVCGKRKRVFIAGTSTFYYRKKKRSVTKELISASQPGSVPTYVPGSVPTHQRRPVVNRGTGWK